MQYPLTVPGVGLSGGKFTGGNPVGGIAASLDRAEDMNLVYDELIAVVTAAGLTPTEGVTTQVRDAILALINGGDYKQSVKVASTAAINLAAPGANIDGVAMVAGDRFLEKDNATAANRGIYIWNGAAVAATRAPDADTGAELNSGAIIPVEQGTVNADTNWQLTTDGTVTIGTTGLAFQVLPSTFASAAEAQALSITNKPLSPAGLALAFQGSNQSLASSGFQKLPGGWIMQWGNAISNASAGASSTFTFPIAFPNAAYSGGVTAVVATATTSSAWCDGLSTTGMGFRCNQTSVNCMFLVIGK